MGYLIARRISFTLKQFGFISVCHRSLIKFLGKENFSRGGIQPNGLEGNKGGIAFVGYVRYERIVDG